jgi:hypothetical protein
MFPCEHYCTKALSITDTILSLHLAAASNKTLKKPVIKEMFMFFKQDRVSHKTDHFIFKPNYFKNKTFY